MEQINQFNQKTDEKMTLDEVSEMFRAKFDSNVSDKESFLKPNAEMFFNQIMKKHWCMNSAEV